MAIWRKRVNIQDIFIYLFLVVNNLRLMLLLYDEKLLQVVLLIDLQIISFSCPGDLSDISEKKL